MARAKKVKVTEQPIVVPDPTPFNVGDKVQHTMSNNVGTILELGNYTTPDAHRVKFININKPEGIITHKSFLRKITPMTWEESKTRLVIDLKHKIQIAPSLPIDPPGIRYQCSKCLGTVSEIDGFIIGHILTSTCST